MNQKDNASLVLKISTDKFALKRQRVNIVMQAQELRKQIYNLSQRINKIEAEIDSIILSMEGKDEKAK